MICAGSYAFLDCSQLAVSLFARGPPFVQEDNTTVWSCQWKQAVYDKSVDYFELVVISH